MSSNEYLSRNEEIKKGSDRSFGIVFCVVFSLIGCWPSINNESVHAWSLVLAAIFFALAILAPKWLAPLNRIWLKFGAILHRFTNPLILGVIFFFVLTPTGLIMRCLGKDFLSLKFDKSTSSYWVLRNPPGPEPESMKHQF